MRSIRTSIAVITTLLVCIGIIMIYSSSGVYAFSELGDSAYFLKRHILFLGLGSILSAGVMGMDYRQLRKIAKPLLVLVIIMLILVLIPSIGKASFGARRWFKFGAFHFQPSEFAKLVMLIYVSDFLARKQNKLNRFKEGFFPIIFILGIVCSLVVIQPDLGNSLLIAGIALIMLFIAGARIHHLAFLGLAALPVIYFLIVRVPYRLRRIIAFLDPWEDSLGAGFQLSQSQIALGSGGVFGLGLGKSMQKLFYLPAAHTDFILSIVGEELGLLGTLATIVLFILLIVQGTRLVKRTQNPFGYYLGAGIMVMLSLQTVINIGVSIGAFPTKGLPLPFISYGGSALMFNMISIALLLNISRTEDL